MPVALAFSVGGGVVSFFKEDVDTSVHLDQSSLMQNCIASVFTELKGHSQP